MIDIVNLTKKFNDTLILDGISLHLKDTGLVAILGKSGSGKTTFLSLIGALDSSYGGSIKIDGLELKELDVESRANLRFSTSSFVFQDCLAQDEERLFDNLYLTLAIVKEDEEKKKYRILECLKMVGLKGKEKMKFKDLSGGEKKRAVLARALIKDTPILLLDEPLASLDKKTRKEISDLLVKLSREKLIVMITHEKEEIPLCADVYLLKEGKLNLMRCGELRESKGNNQTIKRGTFNFGKLLKRSSLFFASHRIFMMIVLLATTLAFFEIVFSFQLSFDVSISLKSTFSKYMRENTVLITPEDGYINDGFYPLERDELYSIKKRSDVKMELVDIYLEDVDSFFQNTQVLLTSLARSLVIPNLKLQSFLDAPLAMEVGVDFQEELEEEEVGLILDENRIKSLYTFLFSSTQSEVSQALNAINSHLKTANVFLSLRADQNAWGYHNSHSLKLKEIFLGEKTEVVVDNPEFNTDFVLNVLHFQLHTQDEEKKVPYSLCFERGIAIEKGREYEFLHQFLLDPKMDSYVIKKCSTFSGLEVPTRFFIFSDYLKKISYAKMKVFAEQGVLEDIKFSSSHFTCTGSSLLSGFTKPVFFSRNLDKLNRIEDENTQTSLNPVQFQSSKMIVEEGVYTADCFALEHQISFESSATTLLQIGKEPKRENEIGISSLLAEEIFSSTEKAIGESLFALFMTDSEENESGFKNGFTREEYRITGVYNSDKTSLFQDELFPHITAFEEFPDFQELRLLQASGLVNGQLGSEEAVSLIKEQCGYKSQFPLAEIIAEIEETFSTLSGMFFFFAVLSLIGALFLFCIALTLIVEKEKKQIGLFLALGYREKDIEKYYLFMVASLLVISFILATLLSLFSKKVLLNTLEDLLLESSSSFLPYCISAFFAVVLLLLLGLYLKYKLKKVSPMTVIKR